MTAQTQYALLIGIPTLAVVLAAFISFRSQQRFLKIMNANFDRLERTLDSTCRKLTTSR